MVATMKERFIFMAEVTLHVNERLQRVGGIFSSPGWTGGGSLF
jgi:hypothetical protein